MRLLLSAACAVACFGQSMQLPPKPAIRPEVDRAFHFGDSISFGGGSSNPSTKSWPSDLARQRGWTLTNFAQSSDYAADQAFFVMGHTVPDTGAISIYALGRNDGAYYGLDPLKEADFRTITLANLAWLAIPESSKSTGKNGRLVYSGLGWHPSGLWSFDESGGNQSLGKSSCQAGDTANAVVFGSVAYIEVSMVKGGNGKAAIFVDGILRVAEVNAFPANDESLSTYNNRSKGTAPQVIRITGLNSAIAHQVQASVLSGCPAIHWIGGNGAEAKPLTVAVGIAKTGSDSASLDWLNPTLQTYNSLIKDAVGILSRDGLDVHFADVWAGFVWPADFCNPGNCDGTHPNDGGHEKLSNAVSSAIRTLIWSPISPSKAR